LRPLYVVAALLVKVGGMEIGPGAFLRSVEPWLLASAMGPEGDDVNKSSFRGPRFEGACRLFNKGDPR